MAGSVNKVILIGNLGKDPEVRSLESGTKVATFSLATSEAYVDKNTNEKKTITDWHNIVLWRGLATIAENYLSKGQKVYVEGKLKTRQWQDKEGNTRYTTEVVADNMTMLGGRQDAVNGMSEKETNNSSMDVNEPTGFEDGTDDLPF